MSPGLGLGLGLGLGNLSSISAVVSVEKMFENVDRRTLGAGVIGILLAPP